MKKIYLGLAFGMITILADAQTYFQSGYGDTIKDEGRSVIGTSTRKYCIVGAIGQSNADSADIGVFIVDSIGGLLTSARIGLPGDEFPAAVVETSDGGFLIAGTTHASSLDSVNTDIFVMKIGGFASLVQWSKVFGGPENETVNSVVKTPDDQYLILGSTKSFGTVTESAFILKVNDAGDQRWFNVCSATDINSFTCGDIGSDQNYVLGGMCSNGTDYDNYIVKMDTLGSMIWSRRFGTAGADWINDIRTTSDGGFAAVGLATLNTAGDTDQNVMRLDSSGATIWTNNYGTAEYDKSASIIETADGNLAVCGYSTIVSPGSIINNMVVDMIDSAGALLWAQTFGDSAREAEGMDIILGNDDGIAAVGSSVAFSDPNGDVFFIKTDSSYSSGCFEYPIVFTTTPATITVDSAGSTTAFFPANEASDTLPVILYFDQYSQNCFFDRIPSLSEIRMRVYPNPADRWLRFESDLQNGVANIYDNIGRLVISRNFDSTVSELDVDALDAGIYILELRSDANYVRAKVLIER